MRTVRIGVVGAGLIGRRHIGAIEQVANVAVAGVVEPGAEGSNYAQTQGLALFESLEQMLDGGEIDGVIIATPTSLHVEQASICLSAKCPVLIEKPISTHTADAEKLVDEAERLDVPILVGHHRRYNPLIQRAHEIISEGRLGKVRGFIGTCWFYKPDPYFEVAPWRKKKGAGPISVNLVHDVDLMRHLVGEVVSVQAQAAPSVRGFENEDVAAAVFRFENGAIGTMTVSDSIAAPWSWEHTSQENPVYPVVPESCYQIGGSEGSLSLPDLRFWSHDGDTPDWWSSISAAAQIRERSDPLLNQIQHFAEVIHEHAQPLVSGREGLRTLRVIEAMQQAAATQETVTFETNEERYLDAV